MHKRYPSSLNENYVSSGFEIGLSGRTVEGHDALREVFRLLQGACEPQMPGLC